MKSHLHPGAPWVQGLQSPTKRKKKMSKYLETQAQIAKLQADLEALRADEFEPEVADIKRRIAAFGMTPSDLFTPEQLGAPKPARKRVRMAPKYQLDGHTWGGRGAVPKWYTEALAAGKTPEEMLIK